MELRQRLRDPELPRFDDGKGGMAQGMGSAAHNLGWWTFSDNLNPGAALLLVPLHGVSATNADSDGDGIPDGVEFSMPTVRAACRNIGRSGSHQPCDIDRDGLDMMMGFFTEG